MKKVMISELKAHLSELLASVRGGETILVCDRRTPVATLSPFEKDIDDFGVIEPRLPISAVAGLKTISLAPGADPLATLAELREERV